MIPDTRRQELFETIRDYIADPRGEDRFESLALEVFRFQYGANEAYRAYCDGKGIDPAGVGRWEDIPAYPSDAFKKNLVISFPYEKTVMANITGGTSDPDLRGIIFRDEYGRELVLAANRKVMGDYVFPEGERMPILVLAPSPETAPSMGMAIGMAETIRSFGTDESGFFITRRGFLIREFMDRLRELVVAGKPVALIGSTSAFIYFFNACRKNGLRFALPAGSRIVDGGGYRGRFGDCGRDEYYERCRDTFGVDPAYCLNVLGMAESATNSADSSLCDLLAGVGRERIKPDLPWCRVVAMDIETCSRVLPPGEVGLLRHYDLANLPTVLGVQTDNLGYRTDDGFEIIGRAHVVDGKVSPMPSEKPVGPMGEKKVFSFLDLYMKFSINRYVSRIKKDDPLCPCGEAIEEMIVRESQE